MTLNYFTLTVFHDHGTITDISVQPPTHRQSISSPFTQKFLLELYSYKKKGHIPVALNLFQFENNQDCSNASQTNGNNPSDCGMGEKNVTLVLFDFFFHFILFFCNLL